MQKHLKIEYGICKQDPFFEILEEMQERSNNTELFRCFCPFLDSIANHHFLECPSPLLLSPYTPHVTELYHPPIK